MTGKRKSRAVEVFETPTPFRGQHDQLDVETIDPNNTKARRVRVLRPNRLRKYRAMGSITEPMSDAGERLASLWEAAGLLPRTTANLNATGGGYRDMSGHQLDAHKAIQKALAGDRRRYADLLVRVCVFDEGVMDTRTLRRGLLRLAIHFGFAKVAKTS